MIHVPVETKIQTVERKMSQLAHYMSAMGKSEHMKDMTFLGILLDQNAIHSAFSPFKDGDSDRDIPFVLIPPLLNW